MSHLFYILTSVDLRIVMHNIKYKIRFTIKIHFIILRYLINYSCVYIQNYDKSLNLLASWAEAWNKIFSFYVNLSISFVKYCYDFYTSCNCSWILQINTPTLQMKMDLNINTDLIRNLDARVITLSCEVDDNTAWQCCISTLSLIIYSL